jgi:hypothetical protein
VITESTGEAYLRMKLKDQAASIARIEGDPALAGLRCLLAPLEDLELRGVAALDYFGGLVWQEAFREMADGATPPFLGAVHLLFLRNCLCFCLSVCVSVCACVRPSSVNPSVPSVRPSVKLPDRLSLPTRLPRCLPVFLAGLQHI